MEDKSQKEPEKLSEEEIQGLHEFWESHQNELILFMKSVHHDGLDKVFKDRSRLDRELIEAAEKYLKPIGKFTNMKFKPFDKEKIEYPYHLDLRGCCFKQKPNFSNRFLPYADFRYSKIEFMRFQKSFFDKSIFNLNFSSIRLIII